MIGLPTPVSAAWPDRAVLEAPGGFCWWYTDLVADEDRALVLIVGWGMPFLPGYASAARAGAPQRPVDRPSVSLAVADRGRLRFWMLQEVPALTWDGDTLTSALGVVRIRPEGFALDADLRGVLAGDPWSLTLEVRGAARAGGQVPHADHEWRVLCSPATATGELRTSGWALALRGRAYVDRNAGSAPLHTLSGPWCWGRVALPGEDRVWYLADGDPRLGPTHVGRWGQRIPAEIALGDDRVALRPIDESPFYTRFLADGVVDGQRVRGIAEWCAPDRIDRAWFRPLVRMAVGPSMWLPLLAGPAEGRVGRLVRQWTR